MSKKITVSDIVINLVFIAFVAFCVLPFILVISVSLTDQNEIVNNGYRFIPKAFSLEAYRYLFQTNKMIGNAYAVTILTTAVGTAANVLFMAMYAYPLSRSDFPYRKFFTWFILITMLISGGIVPSYIINTKFLHLKNTIWALILPSLGGGFNIIVMRTFFAGSIPGELIEAAQVDGAGETRIFFQIILVLSKPVLATMALMNIFGFWNNWTNSLYYITETRLYSLQFMMQKAILNLQFLQQAAASGNTSELQNAASIPEDTVRMAMVIIGAGPVVAVYPFFQKYFTKGLTIGSVKG